MRLAFCLAALMLVAACQLSLPGRGGDAAGGAVSPITGDEITTSRLDAAPVSAAVVAADDATAATPPGRPRPRPPALGGTTAPVTAGQATTSPPDIATGTTTPESAVPQALKSPEQLACEKRGGAWTAVAGGQARACVKRTRDAGRKCDSKSDCQGQCLARSGTCAPVDPLFGCNDVLEGGRRVTICID